MRAAHIHTLWTDAQDRADSPQDAVALLCDAVAYACLQTATDPAQACDRMLAGGEALLRERAEVAPLMRRRALYVVG